MWATNTLSSWAFQVFPWKYWWNTWNSFIFTLFSRRKCLKNPKLLLNFFTLILKGSKKCFEFFTSFSLKKMWKMEEVFCHQYFDRRKNLKCSMCNESHSAEIPKSSAWVAGISISTALLSRMSNSELECHYTFLRCVGFEPKTMYCLYVIMMAFGLSRYTRGISTKLLVLFCLFIYLYM